MVWVVGDIERKGMTRRWNIAEGSMTDGKRQFDRVAAGRTAG